MKKYGICILLVLATAVLCFGAGFWSAGSYKTEETLSQESDSETDTEAEAETEVESQTVTEPQLVINQKEVEPAREKEEFYLVSETGYLLVFAQDQSTICLYTHIPITDFPEKEQEKLRAGIWFSSMMEIFHHLESYTS